MHFLSRLRCLLVGTECSASRPPRLARVTRTVRRASSALRRSGPSRRSPFLRLLLLLQFGVRVTPFGVCGPLLLTYPSFHWSDFLHSAALEKTLDEALSLRPTSSVKVLSPANWLTSSGMSTSTTLARLLLRLRDHLLKCSSLMCLRKTDIAIEKQRTLWVRTCESEPERIIFTKHRSLLTRLDDDSVSKSFALSPCLLPPFPRNRALCISALFLAAHRPWLRSGVKVFVCRAVVSISIQ